MTNTATNTATRFDLGITVATLTALRAIPPDEMCAAMNRHHRGDWGTVCDEDKAANDQALVDGTRILSAYESKDGTKVRAISTRSKAMNKNHAIMKELPPLPEGAQFRIAGVESFNYKPHPFCVTEKHVTIASDRYGGILGPEVCDMAPCGIGRRGSPIRGEQPCQLRYHEHTCEHALVIVLKTKVEKLQDIPGLHEWCLAANPFVEAHKIDGYMFPTEEQFTRKENE